MTITVEVPTTMRPFTSGEKQVEIEAASTVKELIDRLEEQYTGFRRKLLNGDKDLHRYLNLFLTRGDEIKGINLRDLEGLETELQDGDIIGIVPAVAGG